MFDRCQVAPPDTIIVRLDTCERQRLKQCCAMLLSLLLRIVRQMRARSAVTARIYERRTVVVSGSLASSHQSDAPFVRPPGSQSVDQWFRLFVFGRTGSRVGRTYSRSSSLCDLIRRRRYSASVRNWSGSAIPVRTSPLRDLDRLSQDPIDRLNDQPHRGISSRSVAT